MPTSSSPSGHSGGASNFHCCIPLDGYSLQRVTTIGHGTSRGVELDAHYSSDAHDSSHVHHPVPYRRPRTGSPSKRSTRPPLCFQHVAPTYPTGHGLVLRILRATALCYTSSGPWLGASLPEGHGLAFRILRATVWYFASCGSQPGSCISEALAIAFNGCVLTSWRAAVWWYCVSGRLLASWVSGGLQGFCISEEPTWSRTSRRLRVGAEYRRD